MGSSPIRGTISSLRDSSSKWSHKTDEIKYADHIHSLQEGDCEKQSIMSSKFEDVITSERRTNNSRVAGSNPAYRIHFFNSPLLASYFSNSSQTKKQIVTSGNIAISYKPTLLL